MATASNPVPAVLSADERAVLDALAGARGADAAVSIAEIQSRTELSYRGVTNAIENMRVKHKLPIGSARGANHGYFLIESAADLETTTRPLKNQALSMLRVVHSLEGPRRRRLGEMVGQLAIELETKTEENATAPEGLRAARVRGTATVIFVTPGKAQTCWHCAGSGECPCPACEGGREESHGRCAACLGVGRLAWGIQ